MPSDRRDRYYEDDGYDSYDDDDYPEERRPRPRRKSTTQSIMDRVSRSIGKLGINRSPSRTRSRTHRDYTPSPSPPPPTSRRPGYSRRRSATADSYYPPSSSRYHRPSANRHGSSYSPSDRGAADRRDKSRWEHAAKSALDAALVETARVRKEPGSWIGPKGRRVATAALGAAAVNALVAGDHPDDHSKRKKVESALGGLVLNRVLNGPRKELRRKGSYR